MRVCANGRTAKLSPGTVPVADTVHSKQLRLCGEGSFRGAESAFVLAGEVIALWAR